MCLYRPRGLNKFKSYRPTRRILWLKKDHVKLLAKVLRKEKQNVLAHDVQEKLLDKQPSKSGKLYACSILFSNLPFIKI